MYAVFAMDRHPNSLRSWFQAAYSPDAGCPQPQAYLAAELDSLSATERSLVLRHAETCPVCAVERDLAQAFDAETGEDLSLNDVELGRRISALRPKNRTTATIGNSQVADGTESSAERERGRLLRFPGLANGLPAAWRAAAAIVLLIGAGTLAVLWNAPPALPDRQQADAQRSTRIELIGPSGTVAELPSRFAWQRVEDAKRFRLSVYRGDLEPVWQREVSTNSIAADESLVTLLQSGVRYSWQVEALSNDGLIVARSATSEFTIAPSPGLPALGPDSTTDPLDEVQPQ